jgi:hypothetical protein
MSRGVLVAVTGILALISRKYLFNTTAQAAASGITITAPIGATITRVGFGGFPLACAIVVVTCLVSTERLRWGLWFVMALFGTVLAVRLLGAVVDGSVPQSIPLIIPEVVFLTLTTIALLIGRGQDAQRRRLRHES